MDHALRQLEKEYPGLNPRAIAVAEQIAQLLDIDCKNGGCVSPSETGCSLHWIHRELFCSVDTENDDDPPDAPIVIMIHKPHKSSIFSWEDDIEYPATPEAAAHRLVALWRRN